MPMYRVMMAALVFLLASGVAGARTLDQVPPYLNKEGHFVSIPAIAVGGLGGFIGGVLALPAALVAAPIGWAAGDPLGYALLPVSLLATGGAEAGYHVGGAIPWALKNGFYDAPMAGIAKIRGEPASGMVAQVEPPPETSGEIQYLASTPEEARIPVVPPRQYSAALKPPKEPTSLMLKRSLSPFKPPPGSVGTAPAARSAPAASVIPPRPAPAARPAAPVAPAAALAPAPVRAAAPAARAGDLPAEPARSEAPAAEAAPEPVFDDGVDVERPSLKKKKRKFSERFSF